MLFRKATTTREREGEGERVNKERIERVISERTNERI